MKKIFALALVCSLLVTGVCFAEKSKLKKKTWTLDSRESTLSQYL